MASTARQVASSKDVHSKKRSLAKKNDLLIYESIYSNEPLCKVDLEKVHDQIGKKVNQAYDRMANDQNFWISLKKYVAKEQNFDVTNGTKQKQKPLVKNTKEGIKANGINFDGDKANEITKIMRQMSEKIFRRTLKKYNYQMSTENFFLAEGGYGSVFRVHQEGCQYACKVISNEMFQYKSEQMGAVHSSKLRSRFANEVQIMKRVSSHPNIISYVDSFSEVVTQKFPVKSTLGSGNYELDTKQSEPGDSTSNKIVFRNYFLIMEFANSKTLSFYVKNRRSMPENRVKSGIFWPLVSAIKFLHSQKIAHCDIKLSNLLLHSKSTDTIDVINGSNRRQSISSFNYDIKLCDFGLSSIFDPNDEHIMFIKPIGTAFYMAPEILRSYFCYYCRKNDSAQPYCPFKGDIWAMAVCIFYCLHGFYPLDVLCKPNKHERIAELKKIFDKADSSSSESIDEQFLNRFRGILRNCHHKLSFNCQELFCRMLEVDAKKRTDIVEVAEHTYFKHM